MPVNITQKPLCFSTSVNRGDLPVGQPIIFAISEPTIVATKERVKFIAQVHIDHQPVSTGMVSSRVGLFKVTPNNVGIGIFDLRPILETYVKPDNMGSQSGGGATFKGYGKAKGFTMPVHLIDKFSLGDNSCKYFAVKFKIEYAEPGTTTVLNPGQGGNTGNSESTIQYTYYNTVVSYDDSLTVIGNDFGYNMAERYMTGITSKFLSDAPLVQYAALEDYGTMAFLSLLPNTTDYVRSIKIVYFSTSGVLLNTETIDNQMSNGGAGGGGASYARYIHFGIFPANLQGWSSWFSGNMGSVGSYSVTALDASTPTQFPISLIYTVKIVCTNTPKGPISLDPNKGFERIRITWLNRWGAWDYYTFNMKSVRSIKTNRIPYTQMSGTWNEKSYDIQGYKGGKKNFRVNTTENIKFNSDFVTEEEGAWFEQLIGSTEVYILKCFNSTTLPANNVALNTEVQPITITNSSFTRKTKANDKLMQYTFEAEKGKVNRTHTV
tara:strand:+ start:90 stop:1568 length:1479 start_codon:yes stop_codon:yes gene_type:complete